MVIMFYNYYHGIVIKDLDTRYVKFLMTILRWAETKYIILAKILLPTSCWSIFHVVQFVSAFGLETLLL